MDVFMFHPSFFSMPVDAREFDGVPHKRLKDFKGSTHTFLSVEKAKTKQKTTLCTVNSEDLR